MKLLRSVTLFVIIGFIFAAASLLYSSYSSVLLGPGYSFTASEDYPSVAVCQPVFVVEMESQRGWPYGILGVVYDSPEDFVIDSCQGVQDDVYPLSFLANTLIFASISYVVYVLVKSFKKKGVKNG